MGEGETRQNVSLEPPSESGRATDHTERDELLRSSSDSAFNADQALALFVRPDLPSEVIEQIAKNRSVATHRKVRMAIACHARTPRHVSLPLIRQLYTFDLMKVALSSMVPADVKTSADEMLIARLHLVTAGERLTLARRASGKVAAALLLDSDERIMRTALDSARLTEAHVVRVIVEPEAHGALVEAAAHHAKWSLRRDVQAALLRSEHLSLERALVFAREISPACLVEIMQDSGLPWEIKDRLLMEYPI